MTKWVKRAGFLLCAALAALLLLAGVRVNSAGFGLYSWDEDALEAGGEAEALAACIKDPKERKVTLKADKISEYFAEDCSSEEIEGIIIQLLDEWKKRQ